MTQWMYTAVHDLYIHNRQKSNIQSWMYTAVHPSSLETKARELTSRLRVRQCWRSDHEGNACTRGLTIFEPAARFCLAPGSAQRSPWARKSRKKNKIQLELAHAAEMEKRWAICIRGLRASGPFLGPRPAFVPRRTAPRRAPILSEKMKLRTSSRTQHKWSKIRRCMYTRFQHAQTAFEVSGGFGPALGDGLVGQLLIRNWPCASPSS
jgi:hypothetical protein